MGPALHDEDGPAAAGRLPLDPEGRRRAVEEAFARFERHVNPALAKVFRFMGLETLEWKARGSIVTDVFGNDFIDCGGGYGVFCHGHAHPKVVAAVREQLELMPLSSRVLVSRSQADLAELIAGIAPGGLQYTFFSNSGTEAVEAALKFARAATGRTKVVAAEGSFHGKSMGALSATGRDAYRTPFAPLVPGFSHVPFGDAAALEAAVDEETAAVILEPVMGEGGIIVPPDDYLPRAREVCSGRGALLILDEVQTGMGRTGRNFACEHYGVSPDIMCLAKALGGGVMPIGATVGTPRVWEFLYEKPLIHTSTFGGNPLACAAGIAAVNALVEEELAKQSAEKGAHLLGELKAVAARYPEVISEVRGKGLMIGVEVTKEGAGGMLMAELFDRHVLAVYTLNNQRVIRFEPPLNTAPGLLDSVVEAIDAACKNISAVIEEL